MANLISPLCSLAYFFWTCWQLDIFADFEIESLGLEETNEANGGCRGGVVDRSRLGPFGLLVIADETLSELTPIYFRPTNTSDGGLKTYFCADERRYACFLWWLSPFIAWYPFPRKYFIYWDLKVIKFAFGLASWQ